MPVRHVAVHDVRVSIGVNHDGFGLILPIHFPAPTAGLLIADGERFNYRYKRE